MPHHHHAWVEPRISVDEDNFIMQHHLTALQELQLSQISMQTQALFLKVATHNLFYKGQIKFQQVLSLIFQYSFWTAFGQKKTSLLLGCPL